MRIAEIFIQPTNDQVENYTTDQLVMINAHYNVLAERIAEDGYNVPADLTKAIKMLKREIDYKLVADREHRLEVLKARRASMATHAERRQQLDDEIAALEGKPAAATTGGN